MTIFFLMKTYQSIDPKQMVKIKPYSQSNAFCVCFQILVRLEPVIKELQSRVQSISSSIKNSRNSKLDRNYFDLQEEILLSFLDIYQQFKSGYDEVDISSFINIYSNMVSESDRSPKDINRISFIDSFSFIINFFSDLFNVNFVSLQYKIPSPSTILKLFFDESFDIEATINNQYSFKTGNYNKFIFFDIDGTTNFIPAPKKKIYYDTFSFFLLVAKESKCDFHHTLFLSTRDGWLKFDDEVKIISNNEFLEDYCQVNNNKYIFELIGYCSQYNNIDMGIGVIKPFTKKELPMEIPKIVIINAFRSKNMSIERMKEHVILFNSLNQFQSDLQNLAKQKKFQLVFFRNQDSILCLKSLTEDILEQDKIEVYFVKDRDASILYQYFIYEFNKFEITLTWLRAYQLKIQATFHKEQKTSDIKNFLKIFLSQIIDKESIDSLKLYDDEGNDLEQYMNSPISYLIRERALLKLYFDYKLK